MEIHGGSMNQVFLIGRMTSDPDIRVAADKKTTVARYRLAVNRYKRDEADFVNCVSFGKTAEFTEKYLKKGAKIAVHGRLRCDSYTDRDGKKIYTTDIVVEEIEFCESKAKEEKTDDGFMSIPDNLSDLPFN